MGFQLASMPQRCARLEMAHDLIGVKVLWGLIFLFLIVTLSLKIYRSLCYWGLVWEWCYHTCYDRCSSQKGMFPYSFLFISYDSFFFTGVCSICHQTLLLFLYFLFILNKYDWQWKYYGSSFLYNLFKNWSV